MKIDKCNCSILLYDYINDVDYIRSAYTSLEPVYPTGGLKIQLRRIPVSELVCFMRLAMISRLAFNSGFHRLHFFRVVSQTSVIVIYSG